MPLEFLSETENNTSDAEYSNAAPKSKGKDKGKGRAKDKGKSKSKGNVKEKEKEKNKSKSAYGSIEQFVFSFNPHQAP